MKTSTKVLSAVISIGLLSMVQIAPASAGKQIYPASQCVKWNKGVPTPVLNSSRIFNPSKKKDLRVDCPILHENFNKKTGNNLDDADIGIIDQNNHRNARCWAASRYQIGKKLFTSSGGTRFTTGFGPHEQNLDFNKTTRRHHQNWYYIGCIIPRTDHGRRSGITYYSGKD